LNIVFRVDASIEIGSGHVMRCLTLADEFNKNGDNIIFISRKLKGNLVNLIKKKKYSIKILPLENATNHDNLYHSKWLGTDWRIDAAETCEFIKSFNFKIHLLIVDHYALDIKWEKILKPFVKKILIIDDLADRKHDCDFLLDQNYYSNMFDRYSHIVPSNSKLLLGPKYAIIRDEFRIRRKVMDNKIKIFVFFGGTDPRGQTLRMLYLLRESEKNFSEIIIVIGEKNPDKLRIKKFCENSSIFSYYCQIDYMAILMNESSFAICAAGTTTWERYCVGLPAIVISVAHNQEEISKNLGELGVDIYLGQAREVTNNEISESISKFLEYDLNRRRMRARKIVDGLGKERLYRAVTNSFD
jgi:pseudaminic acid biosynthesis-associated protein PseG